MESLNKYHWKKFCGYKANGDAIRSLDLWEKRETSGKSGCWLYERSPLHAVHPLAPDSSRVERYVMSQWLLKAATVTKHLKSWREVQCHTRTQERRQWRGTCGCEVLLSRHCEMKLSIEWVLLKLKAARQTRQGATELPEKSYRVLNRKMSLP